MLFRFTSPYDDQVKNRLGFSIKCNASSSGLEQGSIFKAFCVICCITTTTAITSRGLKKFLFLPMNIISFSTHIIISFLLSWCCSSVQFLPFPQHNFSFFYLFRLTVTGFFKKCIWCCSCYKCFENRIRIRWS